MILGKLRLEDLGVLSGVYLCIRSIKYNGVSLCRVLYVRAAILKLNFAQWQPMQIS